MAAPVRDTVFLVDDDADVRQSARALLESYDLLVQEFSSAVAFLAAFDSSRKGCLVLDLNMPEMGGLELLARLKDLQSALPVIIVTGQDDAEAADRARRAGAFDFLRKPVGESFMTVVDRALKAA